MSKSIERRLAIQRPKIAEDQVWSLVRKHGFGFKVNAGGQWEELTAAAPEGQVWKATGTHEVVCAGSRGQKIGPDFWEAILSDISQGFEPCENKPCDWCEGV